MACRLIELQDGFFDASQHLEEIQNSVEKFDESEIPRTLQFLDCFAGVGSFFNVCTELGYNARSIDKLKEHTFENILDRRGFFNILFLVCLLDSCLNFIIKHTVNVGLWGRSYSY